MLLTHAFALSASQFVHKQKSLRIFMSMHSGGLELAKLAYSRHEDNLRRHRGDRLYMYEVYTSYVRRVSYGISMCFLGAMILIRFVFFYRTPEYPMSLIVYFNQVTLSAVCIRVLSVFCLVSMWVPWPFCVLNFCWHGVPDMGYDVSKPSLFRYVFSCFFVDDKSSPVRVFYSVVFWGTTN